MKEKLILLADEFEKQLLKVSSSRDAEELRVSFLGKKGPLVALMQDLKNVSAELRPEVGKWVNELKVSLTGRIDRTLREIEQREQAARLKEESIDIALPGRAPLLGHTHPISHMIERVVDILVGMGFSVHSVPELESDYYNYAGLNYPEDHPARDMQDTFYIAPAEDEGKWASSQAVDRMLLRSHTTTMQQHVMEQYQPPIRMVATGKCYRNETISTRSHVIFHQIDVMYIDKGVTFGDLLASQEEFYSKLFNQKVEIRVRPSYFPFVEPGMEIDVRCTLCQGSGCRLCKQSGWLEVSGAGMIHPHVLEEGGIDPNIYSGFAWGGGIERLYLMMYGVNDIRLFMENDMRFLQQFA